MTHISDKTDAQIELDVINEIKWDPSVTSSQISVKTKDGIVTLRGSVPHYFEKSRAQEAAQRVAGVRAIADEMEVNLMGSYERSDEQIAEAALDALRWNYSAPTGVKVAVEKGWITLRGDCEWDYQRTAAEGAVSQLMGVCGVTNNITIQSKIQPSDIKNRIEEAFKRSAASVGRQISVSIKGDRVTLAGKVQSFDEFTDAGQAAWMAPGITSVENNIIIAT